MRRIACLRPDPLASPSTARRGRRRGARCGLRSPARGRRRARRGSTGLRRAPARPARPAPARAFRPLSRVTARSSSASAAGGGDSGSANRSGVRDARGAGSPKRSISSHNGGSALLPASATRSPRGVRSARARSTSSTSVQNVAPSRIRSLVPSARGSSGEPGTAKTSRPCSAAKRAVMSEPERRAASTTTIPSERPETSRLRRGKSRPRASQPNGISESAAPSSRICAMNAPWSAG